MTGLLGYKLMVTVLTLLIDPVQPSMLILQSLSGLGGFAGLILSIITVIFLVGDKLPKIFLILPISYVGLGLIGAGVTMLISTIYLSSQYSNLASQPPMIIALIIILRTSLALLIALLVGLKFKKELAKRQGVV
jgi:hypothetical protein